MFQFTTKFIDKNLGKSQLYTAFTLAEVLITLGIIGVVAAFTIPTLMNRTNNQETVSKVKKAYSTFSQAFTLAELNEGTVDTWNWIANGSGQGAANALNTLAPYLRVNKNCGTAAGCFPDITYPYLNKTGAVDYINGDTTYAKAMLLDGTTIAVLSRSIQCETVRGTTPALMNVCGLLYADANGLKGPNQWGKDLFLFYITKYGVIPAGTPTDTTHAPSECAKSSTGMSCAAWVLEKSNMNYLN